jgi:hypothetical protein
MLLLAGMSLAGCHCGQKDVPKVKPPPPPPAVITITVESTPVGAMVTVDGKEIGVTPMKADIPPGPHRLGLAKEGFVGHQADVKLGPNLPASFKASLIAKP